MKRFLKIAGDRLEGDWVILGGAVLPSCGINSRITVDIDIAGPASATQKDSLILMEISESLGLPVETINQAGAFYLQKIPDWEGSLIKIHQGKSATFFRPNTKLFLLLKTVRLSESDLQDCLQLLTHDRKHYEGINLKEISALLKKSLKSAEAERAQRLQILLDSLE